MQIKAGFCWIFFLVFTPAMTPACLWDDDTLRAEAKELADEDTLRTEAGGLPNVMEAITGRIPRNPPLYYEMRLSNSTSLLKENPHLLKEYDNAGVACDRLGRGDEALQWMEAKKNQLDLMNQNSEEWKKHQYRYLANTGTFLVHRWLRDGADRNDISEVEMAAGYIRRAIELNPDAHFGREKYQLMAMEYIIDPKDAELSRGSRRPIFVTISPDSKYSTIERELAINNTEVLEAMIGLMALGNAWASPDVILVIRETLMASRDSSVAFLADLRIEELVNGGARFLDGGAEYNPPGQRLKDRQEKVARKYFAKARREANEWHERRTAFMMERLEQGRHPDWDPNFWEGFKEGKPPEPPIVILPSLGAGRGYIVALILIGVLLSIKFIRAVRRE